MNWQDFRLNTRLSIKPTILEQIYALLLEIDSIKNSWKITQKLQPQTLLQLTQSVIITSTGASNRIEGNRLNDQEVEALYKNLRIRKFKTRDEQEVAGYLETIELIFNNYKNIPINESSILKLHHDLLRYSQRDERHRGHYKFGSNRVEAKDEQGNIVGIIFDPTPPFLVKKEMHELIDWYTWADNTHVKHPLLLIANFIFEFLAIHPFQDGNGRTSRLLTNLMLLQHGYLFATFVSHEKIIEDHKAEYYLALNKTQTTWKTDHEDISRWLLFFLTAVKIQAKDAFKLISGESIEHLLSTNQLALWEWALSLNGKEFSRKNAIEALGFPDRTIEYGIKKLLNMKRLQKLGQGTATRYRVIEQKS